MSIEVFLLHFESMVPISRVVEEINTAGPHHSYCDILRRC